jgi:hypothetical protein
VVLVWFCSGIVTRACISLTCLVDVLVPFFFCVVWSVGEAWWVPKLLVESTLRNEEAPQKPQKDTKAQSHTKNPSEKKTVFYSIGINRPINYSYRGIYSGGSPTPLVITLFYPSTTTFREYSKGIR